MNYIPTLGTLLSTITFRSLNLIHFKFLTTIIFTDFPVRIQDIVSVALRRESLTKIFPELRVT